MVALVVVVKGRFRVTLELMVGSVLMFGWPRGCSSAINGVGLPIGRYRLHCGHRQRAYTGGSRAEKMRTLPATGCSDSVLFDVL